MITNALREFGSSTAFLDATQHIAPGNPLPAKLVPFIQRLKHRRSGLADLCRFKIGVQELLGLVMQPAGLFLVAFFEQPAALACPAGCNHRA
jgi:hypothetical protein